MRLVSNGNVVIRKFVDFTRHFGTPYYYCNRFVSEYGGDDCVVRLAIHREMDDATTLLGEVS